MADLQTYKRDDNVLLLYTTRILNLLVTQRKLMDAEQDWQF